MDAYLEIARDVLERARRPLPPRVILEIAYREDLVPYHLHGLTQHKTLQARLSEDIVRNREHSEFFRTAPGVFFLSKYLSDETIPEEHRIPVPTRRRSRELCRGPILTLNRQDLEPYSGASYIECSQVLDLIRRERFTYSDPKSVSRNSVRVWSFVCVVRPHNILTYRVGRYREDRDHFALKRTVGFSTLVDIESGDLFNVSDLGIVESGVRAVQIDLDIPQTREHSNKTAQLKFFLWVANNDSPDDLIAVIDYTCPSWFEPTRRRLAINDLRWLRRDERPNNLDDFDPWSQEILMKDDKHEMVADRKCARG